MITIATTTQATQRLLDQYSLEITGKDARSLVEAADLIPPKTRVNITYLGNEDAATRVAAARQAKDLGLTPVPHLSARRITSVAEFEEALGLLHAAEATQELFLIGGDPTTPAGPYADALGLIRTGILPAYDVRTVGIAGYPEGHPDISDDALWASMMDKVSALKEQSIEASIITQFAFDAERVAAWITETRERGIDAPIRIGVAGPAGAKRLLGYARRFGVGSSAGIIKKYGFSITNLLSTVGPDLFVEDLAQRLEATPSGTVRLHLYTFGGVRDSASWARGHKIADAREATE